MAGVRGARSGHGRARIAIYVAASIPIVRYLVCKDAALLERHMRGGPMFERKRTQRFVMRFTSLGFIALLVVPALDRRFGWSSVSVAMGYYLILLVYRVNSYTASMIQVVLGRPVISIGPYAVVRHTMYASGSLYIFAPPLALGSYWGFFAIVTMMPFLLWWLLDEEQILMPGSAEYGQRIRRRLVPLNW